MKTKEIILGYLGIRLKNILSKLSDSAFEKIEEIRFRVNRPLIILKGGESFFIRGDGHFSRNIKQAFIINQKDLVDTLQMMGEYSLYAFEEEIRNGYITLPGGHRVGLVGKVVMENGNLKTMRYIGGMNIRISHEVIGCANKIIPYIINGKNIYHTLIISPPKCGKTTLLRDLIRQISNGISDNFIGLAVGVVDERSEIAGCYQGIPQNDVGIRTDVLDCCPKVEGMRMLLRSMSPDVIAVDEIGKVEDIYAIEDVINGGVKLICTVHGSSILDIQRKPVLKELIQKKIFERMILLNYKNGPGSIEDIIDGTTLKSLI
ncbi:stage III sporulation protein AA [Defluviitalea phaphyphila]|uniref:stage III sporulation protein AA n=1 Tax=Defluviitalea phaphyphila TaxID=1473580 RepID=UPI00073141EC|nr:stage III sporulation protein AA [Defluviitalea phaphyphila]